MYGFEIEGLRAPLLHKMDRYWNRLCMGGRLPRKAAIDPADIKSLLPYLSVADHIGQPPRFRFRLVGTEVAKINSLDFTGRWLDEIEFGNPDVDWAALYSLVDVERRPVYGRSLLIGAAGDRFEYEFGLFPLSDDGARTSHTLGFEDFSGVGRQFGATWCKSVLRPPAPPQPSSLLSTR